VAGNKTEEKEEMLKSLKKNRIPELRRKRSCTLKWQNKSLFPVGNCRRTSNQRVKKFAKKRSGNVTRLFYERSAHARESLDSRETEKGGTAPAMLTSGKQATKKLPNGERREKKKKTNLSENLTAKPSKP